MQACSVSPAHEVHNRVNARSGSNSAADVTICQLVHGLPVGGAEVLVTRLVQRLRDRYRLVIACLDEVGELGERLAEEGVRVVHLGRRPGFDWKCAGRLRRLLIAENAKLIHAHQCTPFSYALATRVFGRRPPIVLTEHGRFFPDQPSLKRKLFHRALADVRDQYIAVGKSVRQALIDNEGLPQHRVEVVYNGVAVPCSNDAHRHRLTTRAELGLSENDFMVVQVARLDPIKDHKTAIRAIGLAAPQAAKIRLFIVGDGPERRAIQQEIDDQRLNEHVTMLGQRGDVSKLLSAADAFLLTSVSEGIPVTILEAMAAKVPVVATNVGGVSEIIEDGVSGLLAPAGDAARLASALVSIARSATVGASLTAAAAGRFESHFTEDAMIANYDRIYRDVIAARSSAP